MDNLGQGWPFFISENKNAGDLSPAFSKELFFEF